MVNFMLAIALDSASCMSMNTFYNLMAIGAKQGDSLAIRFVYRVEEAIQAFENDPGMDVLLFQSGELCLAPEAMLDYMYKEHPLTTMVHPLGKIAWDKVAAGISMGSTTEAALLGIEYNVPLSSAEATDDPDLLMLKKAQLTNFKVHRSALADLKSGESKTSVGAYIKQTAALSAKRPHEGCIAHRVFA